MITLLWILGTLLYGAALCANAGQWPAPAVLASVVLYAAITGALFVGAWRGWWRFLFDL